MSVNNVPFYNPAYTPLNAMTKDEEAYCMFAIISSVILLVMGGAVIFGLTFDVNGMFAWGFAILFLFVGLINSGTYMHLRYGADSELGYYSSHQRRTEMHRLWKNTPKEDRKKLKQLARYAHRNQGGKEYDKLKTILTKVSVENPKSKANFDNLFNEYSERFKNEEEVKKIMQEAEAKVKLLEFS